jgi:hypothetical protein
MPSSNGNNGLAFPILRVPSDRATWRFDPHRQRWSLDVTELIFDFYKSKRDVSRSFF